MVITIGLVSADLLENAKVVISNIEGKFLMDTDLYTASQEEDGAPNAAGAGVLYTSGSLGLEDDIESSSEDLDEEAGMSLAIQYSIESRQQSMMEEEQLQKALVLSKKMSQRESSELNNDIRASLEASNTIQLHVFRSNDSNERVELAFMKMVSQRQVVEKLDHHAAGDMTEYDRKCLEAIERKHGVGIQIEGTIINISGFRNFVSQALHDMMLVVNRMSQSASEQEIVKTVQWVFHDPVFSTTTPYSPDVIVLLENAWRMNMGKIDILLDYQRHIINFRDMQEYNTATEESVTISRETIDSQVTDSNGPGKEFLQRVRIFLYRLITKKPVAMSFSYPQSCCFSKAFDQLMGAESFQERCAPC